MINWRRPSNRSSRLTLPLGPSNSYLFFTASHGILRRSAARASRARVNSFSFTRSCRRAVSHSFGDTTFGISMSLLFFDVIALVHIFFPVRAAARDYIYIMSGFFEELQRRKVYRVAAAYIVVAGFLIQIASAAFPAWELPNWSLRLVIALLLIGFPIA